MNGFEIFLSLWFGYWAFKAWIRHRERLTELRAMGRLPESRAAHPDLKSLREEVERLRDTTTRYDMSVEHAIRELRERIVHLEARLVIDRPFSHLATSGESSDEPAQMVTARQI